MISIRYVLNGAAVDLLPDNEEANMMHAFELRVADQQGQGDYFFFFFFSFFEGFGFRVDCVL
jgi:hypothetical protein